MKKRKNKGGRIQKGKPRITICSKKTLATQLTEEDWHV